MALRQRYGHPSLFTLYRDPLMLVEGHMQWLFDETGRRYLDMFAGIATVACGHSHPEVVRRVREQADILQHTSTLYLHPNGARFARELAARMPAGLDVTYLVTPRYGAGVLLRYTRGSIDIEGATDSLAVGGFQIGAGLRVRF